LAIPAFLPLSTAAVTQRTLAARSAPLDPLADADRRPRLALLVSDREWSTAALASLLGGEGYATLRAATSDEAVAVCAAAEPDLVFVEQRLAGWRGDAEADGGEPGGLALCRRLRRDRVVTDATPLVVITVDAAPRADVLAALDAGAWELCTLPFDAPLVLARCAAWVRAKRWADRTAEVGGVDPETGLYNLRGLARRAGEIVAVARRLDDRAPWACVAFSDAPTPVGGAVRAARVGALCRSVIRASDVVARVGVRDFAVLTRGRAGNGGARRLAERLETALWLPRADTTRPSGVIRWAEEAPGGEPSSESALRLVMRTVAQLHRASS
jgi:CheY-like chemotaxis protein